MSAMLLSGPAAEPLTLDEAKAFLRVEHDDDDDVVAALIAGARLHVEAQTRRALIAQTWRLVLHCWPSDGRVPVVPSPLRALIAVRVYRSDGSTQAIAPASFIADTAGSPPVLAFAAGALPAPGRVVGGIELDVETGYGDRPGDVPEPLRQAIRLLVAHWYENRGAVAVGQSVAVLPQSVAALIAPYRVLAL
jgi:uncharacterized phiE125 gp8 family phage protein